MARARLVRLFWIGAAAVLMAAALIGIVAVVRGDLGEADGKILITLSALLLAGAAAVSALVLYESGVLRPLAVAALVPVPIGFALIAAWAWRGFEGDNLARWAGSGALALVACLVLTTAGILCPPRRRVALWALAVLVGGALLLTHYLLWAHDPGESAGKATAVLWISSALAWGLVPVLAWYERAGPTAEERVIAVLGGLELVAGGPPGGEVVAAACSFATNPARQGSSPANAWSSARADKRHVPGT